MISNNFNENKKLEIIQNFVVSAFNITAGELTELKNFTNLLNNRLKQVFEYAINKNCNVMVDAEQTYIQHYIDFLTAYLFKVYNKENSILSTTLQCYLKTQVCRLMKWFEFCRVNDVKLGLKMVRGAYLTEERKLALENNYPSPICETIEETHNNYDYSLDYIFENIQEKEKVNFLNFYLLKIFFTLI